MTRIVHENRYRQPDRFWSGLRVQIRVLHALMIREALKKHGHESLGFFWIIGEPLVLMAGITILWSMLHMSHSSDVDVVPFALTGYSFVTLWRHVSGQAVRIMQSNIILLYHRQVKLVDVVIAKALLETLCLFTAFTISYIPTALLGYCPILNDPLLLVGGFLFTGWFAFGFGLILACLSEVWEPLHNVIGAIMYITLPMTGAFTMQEWMPDNISYVLSWSPLVNCIEMLRGGLFPPQVSVHFDTSYLVVCCSSLTIIGFALYKVVEKKVHG